MIAPSFDGQFLLYPVYDEYGMAPMKVEVTQNEDPYTGLPYYVDPNGNEYVVEPDGTVTRYHLDPNGNRIRGKDSKGKSFDVK
jgi:YD repeat-containing protein